MTPFFDAGAQDKPAEAQGDKDKEPARRRVIDREAVELANKALNEVGLDSSEPSPGGLAVKYETKIAGNWQIDYGTQGDDFMIQMIPRRQIRVNPASIVEAFINALSTIVPSDVQVYIKPPIPRFEIDFFTIKLEAIMKKPGAEQIVERRVLDLLGQINAWAV